MRLSRYALLLLVLASPACAQELYTGTVEKVVDGDTIKVDVPGWPLPFKPADIRIYGIDTPETRFGKGRAQCLDEKQKGKLVTRLVAELLPKGTVITLQLVKGKRKRDKYGRPLMRIFLPDGTNLGRKLLLEHLALENDGKRKGSWCGVMGRK